jgi:hypothetical protein
MPGNLQDLSAARPRTAPSPFSIAQRLFERLSLTLHLTWDAGASVGTVWGEAWDAATGECAAIPSVELGGADVHTDVLELLASLWTEPADA